MSKTDDLSLQTVFESEWYLSRPQSVKDAVKAYPPGRMYRLKETGQIGQIVAYTENDNGSCDKCIMLFYSEDNPKQVEKCHRQVFGIKLTSLKKIDNYQRTK